MRYDIPVVGLKTMKVLKKINAAVLAVEAGRTIMLEQDKVIVEADKQGLALVAVEGVPVGTTVVAGRVGSLREGTPVTAAQVAVAPRASAPAPATAASRTTP